MNINDELVTKNVTENLVQMKLAEKPVMTKVRLLHSANCFDSVLWNSFFFDSPRIWT